ncbi:MAG TPA: MFS transporter [Acidobacteriota bacterium]|jgi:MFS family permease|nr:MFS transporter [Acidobacteriota bacterium]
MTDDVFLSTMTNDRARQYSGTYRWAVVAMLWFVCFFNYADRQAIFSVFPLLKPQLKLSDMQLGIIGSSFMWVYAASAPFAGMVGDRFRRKTVIIAGLIFWSLITVATALSTRYIHLVIFRALEGLGEAFYFPASMSLISDYHGPDTRSRAMSTHQSSVYIGTAAGGTVAGILGQHYGWRSSFYLFGSLGVLLGFILIWALREPERETSATVGSVATPGRFSALAGKSGSEPSIGVERQTASSQAHLGMAATLMAVFAGANFVAMVFLTWMPSFLYRKFGMSLSMSGFSGTAYLQTASILGVITGGVLADRLARHYSGGRMMAQALGLLAGAPFIFLTGWTLSVPLLILAMAGFGYFKGMYDANIFASLYDVVRPERRATAAGLMNAVGWVGGSTAPVAIAAASERFGMSACISANSVIYLVFGLLLVAGVFIYTRSGCPVTGGDVYRN